MSVPGGPGAPQLFEVYCDYPPRARSTGPISRMRGIGVLRSLHSPGPILRELDAANLDGQRSYVITVTLRRCDSTPPFSALLVKGMYCEKDRSAIRRGTAVRKRSVLRLL